MTRISLTPRRTLFFRGYSWRSGESTDTRDPGGLRGGTGGAPQTHY